MNEDIFRRYFDHTLSSDEARVLAEALESDSEVRRQFAAYVIEEGLLVQAAGFLQAESETSAIEEEQPVRWHQAIRRLILPLAAMLVLAVGVWWFTTGGTKIEGSDVTTGKGQTIALRFDGEDTLVEMAENTKLRVVGGKVEGIGFRVQGSGLEKQLNLESGSINVSVAKQTEGRSFIVRSAQAEIQVVGTKFSVGIDVGKRATWLRVDEGVVRMKLLNSGGEEEVRAGAVAVVKSGVDRVIRPGRITKDLDMARLTGSRSRDVDGVAFDGKLLWLWTKEIRDGKYVLLEVDPDTDRVLKRVQPVEAFGRWSPLASDGQYLWGYTPDGSGFMAVDPVTTKKVRTIPFPPGFKAGSDGFDIWQGVLWIWSPEKNRTAAIRLSDGRMELVGTGTSKPEWELGRTCCGPDGFYLGQYDGRGLVKVDYGMNAILSSTLSGTGREVFHAGDMAYDPGRGLWVGAEGHLYLVDMD
jgi:ferric-dicitrate binding protein FerR (iron transport regulator)